MKDIQDVLTNTYKQNHYSLKALRELRNIADALEEKVLKPTNLHGTRWLPHVQKALTVLLKNYRVIVTHFDHIIHIMMEELEMQKSKEGQPISAKN